MICAICVHDLGVKKETKRNSSNNNNRNIFNHFRHLTGLAGSYKRESISGDTTRVSVRVTSAQAWFTSSQLQSHLTSAVSELQSALNRMSEAWDGDSGRDDRGQLAYGVMFYVFFTEGKSQR